MDETGLRHFLLVRHGETDANIRGIVQGHLPSSLSDVGLQQAGRLATRLRHWRPTIGGLITSDLCRAVQTAEQIAASCGLEPQHDPIWREACSGVLEGQTFAEYNAWFQAHGVDALPPGAESSLDFDARVTRAMQQLPTALPNVEVVAVVSHGGPICTVHRLASEGALPMARCSTTPAPGPVANCSIMHLVWHPAEQAWEMRSVNDVAHLAQ